MNSTEHILAIGNAELRIEVDRLTAELEAASKRAADASQLAAIYLGELEQMESENKRIKKQNLADATFINHIQSHLKATINARTQSIKHTATFAAIGNWQIPNYKGARNEQTNRSR